MTITPEETSRLANAAERKVYQAPDRAASTQRPSSSRSACHRPSRLEDHEVDFVVAIEGAGIVCLEVKGGDVWHDGETWWQKRRGHEHKIDPVRQALRFPKALIVRGYTVSGRSLT